MMPSKYEYIKRSMFLDIEHTLEIIDSKKILSLNKIYDELLSSKNLVFYEYIRQLDLNQSNKLKNIALGLWNRAFRLDNEKLFRLTVNGKKLVTYIDPLTHEWFLLLPRGKSWRVLVRIDFFNQNKSSVYHTEQYKLQQRLVGLKNRMDYEINELNKVKNKINHPMLFWKDGHKGLAIYYGNLFWIRRQKRRNIEDYAIKIEKEYNNKINETKSDLNSLDSRIAPIYPYIEPLLNKIDVKEVPDDARSSKITKFDNILFKNLNYGDYLFIE